MEEFWINILPNADIIMCEHYCKNILVPLSLTCKTLNNVYKTKLNKNCLCTYCSFTRKLGLYKSPIRCLCGICSFRFKNCASCIKNGTDSCAECICKKCNISTNLCGGDICNGLCQFCSPSNVYKFCLHPEEYRPSGSWNYSNCNSLGVEIKFIGNIL